MRFASALLIILLIISIAFAITPHNKIDPALHLLLASKDKFGEDTKGGLFPLAKQYIDVAVRFDHQLTDEEISALEIDGCQFKRIEGKIYDTGNIYALKIPWNLPRQLAEREDVLQISASWHPQTVPCLDVSNPEIQADMTWGLEDPSGLPVTGQGQIVADFDTGIDVFHPAFFRLTSDTLDWLDVNDNDIFDPGIDAVDKNGNTAADPDEILGFIDGWIYDEAGTFGGQGGISNNDSLYQPEWDWLYNDADESGEREFGYWYGFTESDPTYGERLYISIDQNQNSILDPGEKLVPLGESKIYKTMNSNDIVRTRGIDLIYSDPDYEGHGTAVNGIIAGGHPGFQRFTGIAPGVDLIIGYHFYGVSFETYLPFVREQGGKTLLYEFGSWVFHPLDGSEVEEQLIDLEAFMGVQQICPSGNLNRGYKHAQTIAAPGEETDLTFAVQEYNGQDPIVTWMTVLWREYENDLSFSLTTPGGQNSVLNGNGTYQNIGEYSVYSNRTTSLRNTAEFDIQIYADDVLGNWILTLENEALNPCEVNGYIADNESAWEGGAEFIDYRSTMKTVTFPSTADSAYVLGSYSTRGYEQYIGVGSGSIQIGQLSKFSGRGPRIDGIPILSVIAPGNYDVYSARFEDDYPGTFGGWRQFSGTSAAGPHVAAACALLKQGLPWADQYQIGVFLQDYAYQDNFTGFTYNDSCGYGKIRIYDALSNTGVIDFPYGEQPRQFALHSYPNPFNAETNIAFYLPVSGVTEVAVYDLLGREIARLNQNWLPAGEHRFSWSGEGAASGIYFLRVSSGEYKDVKKLVLLK